MSDAIKRIVIVGGGSAGWLVAATIAAEHQLGSSDSDLKVILVESPDIPTIGVGEGTWPSMSNTLRKIGVSESQFIRECDVSFKQGSKFIGWSFGGSEYYYHPFTLPAVYNDINLSQYWPALGNISFSDAVCPQSIVCEQYLAPKQITTPEFAHNLNYGYHLNAGKFSDFLRNHSIQALGVTHVLANVSGVQSKENGDIELLLLDNGEKLDGDLFIDCTGFSSLLLGEHYKIPFKSLGNVLFNDSALAVQVPYANPDAPIASSTMATAQDNGWVWDIGLPTRRGVGHVFSSAHTNDEQVELNLRRYLEASVSKADMEKLSIRKLSFNPGHREKFWHRNCVAVGISAGFIEPLEATALVLIELSAQMISEQLPANRDVMDVISKRFNEKFNYRWSRIVEFLKLHYVLNQRKDSQYWMDHCDPSTIPESLREQLILWRYQAPWKYDSLQLEEMFPSASYQYVLYGMGFKTTDRSTTKRKAEIEQKAALQAFNENRIKTQKLMAHLPTNRGLLNKLREFEFQKI